MTRLLAIGDHCADLYLEQGCFYPGGNAVNVAVHARRAGLQASFAGVLGDDVYGHAHLAALAAEGVDTSHVCLAPGVSAWCEIHLRGGDRVFGRHEAGVRSLLRPSPALLAFARAHHHVHTTVDGHMEEALADLRAAAGSLSYDFSTRYHDDLLAMALPHLDYAFFSGARLAASSAPEAARFWRAGGARVVVVTLGAAGSLAWDGATLATQPALPTEVVDTLGAGDAFIGAFLAAHLQGASLAAALGAGAAAAARACTHYGGFGHPQPLPGAAPTRP